MSDSQLKETLKNKLENGDFTSTDLPAFFEVFSRIGNQIEDLQEEVKGWDRVIEFEMAGVGTYWLVIQDGHFSTGSGARPDTHLRLIMAASEVAMIFSGEKDTEAVLASGALKLDGNLLDAIKLYKLIELVLEEIEY
jgi:hypothetical protein